MGEQKKYQGDNRVAKRNRKFYNSGVKIKTTTSGSAGTESDGAIRSEKDRRQEGELEMIVIVCTEDRGGMLFNNRRVSKDRTVIQKILELSEGKKLWIHPFSEKLFEQEHPENCCVDENFLEKAGEGDICFVENQSLKGTEGRIEKLIVFGWNRAYPFDLKLDLDLEQMEKTAEEEFAGYSHEKITRLQYRKKDRA